MILFSSFLFFKNVSRKSLLCTILFFPVSERDYHTLSMALDPFSDSCDLKSRPTECQILQLFSIRMVGVDACQYPFLYVCNQPRSIFFM